MKRDDVQDLYDDAADDIDQIGKQARDNFDHPINQTQRDIYKDLNDSITRNPDGSKTLWWP